MQVAFRVTVIIALVIIKIDLSEPFDTDFGLIEKRSSFVDKTPLINDVFKHEMVLLVAPPGYGKSTILSMVKRFLEIVLDENCKQEIVYTTGNYELFKKEDLKICRYPYDLFFNEQFGVHPVLYIDYSDLRNVKNFEDMLTALRKILYRTYLPQKHILNNKELVWTDETAKDIFSKCSDYSESKNLTEEYILRGFYLLSRMMCHHYSKRVFVLIDEYNTYLKCLPERGIPDSDKIIKFVQAINDDLIKANAFIDHALLMGVPLHNDTDVWPDNILKFKFLEKHCFQKYFGVFEDEVSKNLKKNFFKKEVREEVKRNLIENHNGLSVDGLNVYSFPYYLSVFRNITYEL